MACPGLALPFLTRAVSLAGDRLVRGPAKAERASTPVGRPGRGDRERDIGAHGRRLSIAHR